MEVCLRDGFGDPNICVNDVSTSSKGACKDAHLVACTNVGKYTIKRWSEAKRQGRSEERHCAQDQLMNEFAKLVNAPNLCPTSYCNELDIENFKGLTFAMVQWLPRSTDMESLSDDVRNAIRTNGDGFFAQFGEWLVFSAATGAQDWIAGNFVWSHSDQKLARIDMDWSFETGYQRDPMSAIKPLHKINEMKRIDGYISALESGCESMKSKLEPRLAHMRERLNAAKYVEIRNFQSNLKIDEHEIRRLIDSVRFELTP